MTPKTMIQLVKWGNIILLHAPHALQYKFFDVVWLRALWTIKDVRKRQLSQNIHHFPNVYFQVTFSLLLSSLLLKPWKIQLWSLHLKLAYYLNFILFRMCFIYFKCIIKKKGNFNIEDKTASFQETYFRPQISTILKPRELEKKDSVQILNGLDNLRIPQAFPCLR